MDKFSIYDLLGLILPGAVLLFMLKAISELFGIAPEFNFFNDKWELIVLFSLILGSFLYVAGFTIANKTKRIYKIFGGHKHVTDLYLEMNGIHFMNETFNKRAKEWYKKNIYFDKKGFEELPEEDKKTIKALQSNFYDRMYYELDYNDKLNVAKSFQGFYFFFRQLIVASSIALIVFLVCYGCSFLSCWNYSVISICSFIFYLLLILLFIVFLNLLARWYRKRMVAKMYWFFYTHINSKK